MINMIIEVADLDDWSNKIESRDTLPLLIRKLIQYSSDGITFSYFPTKSRVGMHGPDGVIKNDVKTQYVPKGTSFWEIGSGENPIKKADEDFDKRTKNPPYDIIPSETTYIHVTSRACSYEKLTNWHEKQNEKKKWKNVRIYDAHTLEEWIEASPPVEKWLANELNIPINGVTRLKDWWEKWCITDEFKLQPNLLLTDREPEFLKLSDYLNENKDINVKGSSTEESIAFLYSTINNLEEKNKLLERCLIIEDKETLEYYLNRDNLILIPTFDYKEPNVSKNMIYKPLLPSDPSKTMIELEDPMKKSFEKSLEDINVPKISARTYSQESMGNINILKRLLSSDIKSPEWVCDDYMNSLIILFFIESWDEHYDDSKIIDKMYKTDYDDFIEKCGEILVKEDSPLINIDSQWFVKSPKDMLYFISMRLTDRYLNKLENSVLDIFDKSDESILNGNFDKKYSISSNLKEGILNSLILISRNHENFKNTNISKTTTSILNKLNKNPYCFWNYNSHYLSYFAKISPKTFVELLKNILEEKPEIIHSLFPIEKYTNKYIKLIWALESIADDYLLFEDIVQILATLSHLNYNERTSPKPIEILCKLFISMRLNKNIPFNFRLKILENLLNNDVEIGWEILTGLLDTHTRHPTYPYDFESKDDPSEFDKYKSSLENYLLEYSAHDSLKWCFILKYYQYCSFKFKTRILDKLNDIKNDLDDKTVIWNKLREIIGQYNDFHKDEEYFEKEVKPLEDLYDVLTPDDSIEDIRWAFDSHFPSPKSGKYKDHGENLQKIRNEIINELYDNYGFEGIYNLITTVNNPEIISYYCLDYDIDNNIIEL